MRVAAAALFLAAATALAALGELGADPSNPLETAEASLVAAWGRAKKRVAAVVEEERVEGATAARALRESFTTLASSNLLSKNKPATQSSTGWGGVASRAVDGNTNAAYGGNSCTHSHKQQGWWQIGVVKLFNRARFMSNMNNLKVYVDGQYCGKSTSAASSTVDCKGKKGKIVKVKRPDTGWLTLCEVQVYKYVKPAPPPPPRKTPQMKCFKAHAWMSIPGAMVTDVPITLDDEQVGRRRRRVQKVAVDITEFGAFPFGMSRRYFSYSIPNGRTDMRFSQQCRPGSARRRRDLRRRRLPATCCPKPGNFGCGQCPSSNCPDFGAFVDPAKFPAKWEDSETCAVPLCFQPLNMNPYQARCLKKPCGFAIRVCNSVILLRDADKGLCLHYPNGVKDSTGKFVNVHGHCEGGKGCSAEWSWNCRYGSPRTKVRCVVTKNSVCSGVKFSTDGKRVEKYKCVSEKKAWCKDIEGCGGKAYRRRGYFGSNVKGSWKDNKMCVAELQKLVTAF